MSPSLRGEGLAVEVPRDPEVRALHMKSLKLVVKAEMLLEELDRHNRRLEGFLETVRQYTERGEGDRDGS